MPVQNSLETYWKHLIYRYICMHIIYYAYVCVYIFVSVYTYIYIYTHTHTHIYIYIYIYVLSITDRLFCCITTLQCGSTHERFQAGIKAWLTLHHLDMLPQSHCHSQHNWRNFFIYIFKSALLVTKRIQFLRRAIAFQCMWQLAYLPTSVQSTVRGILLSVWAGCNTKTIF